MSTKKIDVFARTKKDVLYRLKRATDFKDYVVGTISKVGKDALGNNKYRVSLRKRKNRKRRR